MILYLHGFLSSPGSRKALQLQAALEQNGLGASWRCPQLPASPAQAARLLRDTVANRHEPLLVIGSSLGGYYAIWLAESLGCRALLINPAVHPARGLAARKGETLVSAIGETVVIDDAFIAELLTLETLAITRPERYFLMATTGDEVLDYRDMIRFFMGASMRVVAGSDHAFTDFPTYLPEVIGFCTAAMRHGAESC
jgi:predicted esterase YcpF (UPF0227 family)